MLTPPLMDITAQCVLVNPPYDKYHPELVVSESLKNHRIWKKGRQEHPAPHSR